MMIKSFINLFIDSGNSFEGQEKDESIILVLRKHVFVIYSQLTVFGILVLIPFVAGSLLHDFLSGYGLFQFYIFLSSVWYLFVWCAIFYSLTMYCLNVVVVTNHRIIDANQSGFFNRKISELHLSRVQDISVQTKGIIETGLKFGDIEVQTASEERQFIFKDIPNPEHVKDVIMDLSVKHHYGSIPEIEV